MTGAARILFAGTEMTLDPSGALYVPAQRVLVVADLHFEKGRAIGLRNRRPLPPYDTEATLQRLAGVVDLYDPSTVVCLGDSFHDLPSVDRFVGAAQRLVDRLAAGRRWIWVCGNHDPVLPARLGGESAVDFSLGSLIMRHDHGDGDAATVIGHFHPVALALIGGRLYRGRCFALNRRLLVMPSFGAYTGGLNILHPDLAGLLGPRCQIWLLQSGGVYPVSRSKLLLNPTFPLAMR